ncbi:MAG TPA: rhodanese-like domain-containing protein [Candidatus Saccharimonadales bacterium]
MNYIFIDVREPYEYEAGHVKGALNIPPFELMRGASELKEIPKDAPLVLYCHSGSRSNAAMHILRTMGYTNLTNGINQGQVEARYF